MGDEGVESTSIGFVFGVIGFISVGVPILCLILSLLFRKLCLVRRLEKSVSDYDDSQLDHVSLNVSDELITKLDTNTYPDTNNHNSFMFKDDELDDDTINRF